MSYHTQDTITAVASAHGGAGRGIVRISGSDAIAIVRSQFNSEDPWPPDVSSLPTAVAGRFQTSTFRQDLPIRVYLWPTQRSFTREPLAEIHTLGSPPLLEAVVQTLLEQGARLAEPGEFTLRAFLAGRIDLTQAEAVLGVIDANGRRQLDDALSQLSGGLSGPLQAIRDELVDLLAHLEAGLDFVEEDIEFISQDQLQTQLQSAAGRVDELLDKMTDRHISSDDVRVALIGLPNAGKSSLLNALAGEQVAIVSAEAGTTRDFVSRIVDCEGISCQIIDTAGAENFSAEATISSQAQQMAGQQSQQAQLRILCVDSGRMLSDMQQVQLNKLKESADIIVRTKCDLSGPNVSLNGLQESAARSLPVLETSAKLGTGLKTLKTQIAEKLFDKNTETTGIIGPTAARCRESLRQTVASLRRAESAAAAGYGEELVAAEIRVALDQLGKVVGTIYTDDILDRVFSRFCIGK